MLEEAGALAEIDGWAYRMQPKERRKHKRRWPPQMRKSSQAGIGGGAGAMDDIIS